MLTEESIDSATQSVCATADTSCFPPSRLLGDDEGLRGKLQRFLVPSAHQFSLLLDSRGLSSAPALVLFLLHVPATHTLVLLPLPTTGALPPGSLSDPSPFGHGLEIP